MLISSSFDSEGFTKGFELSSEFTSVGAGEMDRLWVESLNAVIGLSCNGFMLTFSDDS